MIVTMNSRTETKIIEDLSLNAWPSHQMQLYDGWILRFSYFYTHRTNCVEQIGPSTLPLPEKVRYCEDIYRRWGTPAIFKITPLTDPDFDLFLENRGYGKEHINHIMRQTFPLCGTPEKRATAEPLWKLPYPLQQLEENSGEQGFAVTVHPDSEKPSVTLECTSFIPDAWIEGLFSLKHTTNAMHRRVVPSMYRAIPKDTVCVALRDGKQIIGTGLGILDREYIGIYAIHVHPHYRRRHYGRTIVCTLLQKGRMLGAEKSYLQVVDGNTPAKQLYTALGFSYAYTCWFRVRQLL